MKRILSILLALTLCCALIVCVGAASAPDRLVDDANLLSASEEATLIARLDEISEESGLDVLIVTVDSIGYGQIEDFAEERYLDADLGEDGIVLLIEKDSQWSYVLFGESDDVFGEKEYQELEDAFLPELRDEAFLTAFLNFANTYAEIMADTNAFSFGTLVLAIVFGAFLAFLIPMSILKGQLKSVRMQAAASSYVRPGSMHLTQQRDIFLYRNVIRTAKPKNNSGGSGGRSSTTGGGRSARSGRI